jgi:hypothetical protein
MNHGQAIAAAALWVALAGVTAAAGAVAVPSGQPVTLDEVIWEDGDGAAVLRLRFLAPEIAAEGGTVGFEAAEGDMHHLCETVGLPLVAAEGRAVAQIVVSLADRPVPFGEADPAVTQFFDAFRPEAGSCVWEGF